MLALEPFFQVSIRYDGKLVVLPQSVVGLSTRPRVAGLDVGSKIEAGDRAWASVWFYMGVHRDMQKVEISSNLSVMVRDDVLVPNALLSSTSLLGFSNSSLVEVYTPPSARCATGNCTWPTFASLELCSSCTNIT